MKTLVRAFRLPSSVALALLFISASWVHATEAWVLSAGVDNYAHIGDLKGCVADAQTTTAVFNAQAGKLFTRVYAQTLVNGQATKGAILQRMQEMSRRGNAGDYMVIFLSGHGGRTNNNQTWYFCPQDYHPKNFGATALTDREILNAAHAMVVQGKKVFIIVDACYSGQLNIAARGYMQNYRQGGGLVVMVSSAANQTSRALGQYSAFARAFAESMSNADSNRDGRVTLDEVRGFTYRRTHQLAQGQNSEVSWSPSMGGNLTLAVLRANNPQPAGAPTWVGRENLQGFGNLAFTFHNNGQVTMRDARGTSQGTWTRNGSQVVLRFSNGQVVYNGTINGNTMSGTARNSKGGQWNWSVQLSR